MESTKRSWPAPKRTNRENATRVAASARPPTTKRGIFTGVLSALCHWRKRPTHATRIAARGFTTPLCFWPVPIAQASGRVSCRPGRAPGRHPRPGFSRHRHQQLAHLEPAAQPFQNAADLGAVRPAGDEPSGSWAIAPRIGVSVRLRRPGFGATPFASRKVVRALGIEPRSPASETGALSIVLCPQGRRG